MIAARFCEFFTTIALAWADVGDFSGLSSPTPIAQSRLAAAAASSQAEQAHDS